MPKKNNAKRRASREDRSGVSAESAESTALQNSPPRKPTRTPRKLKARCRARKRVRLGDALRQRGLDEHTVADNYVGVIEKLRDKTDKSGSVEKLLVDVLKECSRHLEPARPAGGPGDMPVHVHLVHNVSRPERMPAEHRTENRS